MTTTINWGDGTTDKITLTYSAAQGDQTVQVSSDPNTGDNNRSKTITFSTTAGTSVTRTLTINQAAVAPTVLTLNPSAFVSGTYASISGQTNPVGKSETNTTYATVNLVTGNNAQTYAFWKFDCSSIPADATIVSVECTAKAMTQQAGGNRVATYEMQMYKGTSTAKGSAAQLSTSASAQSITCGTWTREELNDINIRLHAQRGKNSTTTTYYLRFYGATLTVTYK